MAGKSKTPHSLKGWKAIAKELDIAAEAQELGITISKDHPSSKDYLTCWAYDRPHGDSPSAGINIKTGWYKDHGGTGEGAYLYELRHKMGLSQTVEDALKHYAIKAGKIDELSNELHARAYAEENVQLFEGLGYPGVQGLYQKYPDITPDAVALCGGNYAKWPKTSPDPNYVVAFRTYDSEMHQMGFVLQSTIKRGIAKYQGKDKPVEWVNRLTVGTSGLVGEKGLAVMQSDACELVIKVEGISDMLALQSIIPVSLRDKVAVVSNASGAREVPAHAMSLFRGKRVVVIHDADEPGQEGAKLWGNVLLGLTKNVYNLCLFPEITPNHGKDLRDWLKDGGDWGKLKVLIESAPKYTPGAEGMTLEQQALSILPDSATDEEREDFVILSKLGVTVMGHLAGTNRIVCCSKKTRKGFEIGSIDRYKPELALLNMGSVVDEFIAFGDDPPPGKYSMARLRLAIARTASKKEIGPNDKMGAGVWFAANKVLMINDTEVSIVNGEIYSDHFPMFDGRLIEFAAEPWYSHDEISSYYKMSRDRSWCVKAMEEAERVFERWDNWKVKDSPSILSAMVTATWIQSTLAFRPGMVITGPTNSGKTMLTQECIAKMFGRLALFVTNPTEAGIRQAIGNTSMVLMIDEFESSGHRDKILEVLRSSTRGTDIVKGTTDQRGTRFHLRHIPWLSSIETGLKSAADRNRYIILDLDHVDKTSGNRLEIPPIPELEAVGRKLLAVGMRHQAKIRELHVELKSTSVEGVDRRIIEAYALPAAVIGAVHGLDLESGRIILRNFLQNRFTVDDFADESDEAALLEAISMTKIRGAGAEFPVNEMLLMQGFDLNPSYQDRSVTPESCLASAGIKRTRLESSQGRVSARDADGVAIAANTFRPRLRGSRFEGMNIEEILLRIPRAKRSRLMFGNARLPCVVIPMECLAQRETDDGDFVAPGASEEDTGIF